MADTTSTRLYKSKRDRVFFGVAGGLAEYFDVEPWVVRLAFVLLLFANGAGLLLYLILTLVVPRDPKLPARRTDLSAARGEEDVQPGLWELGSERGSEFEAKARDTGRRSQGLAWFLIAAGALILLANVGMFWWFPWHFAWPVLLVAVGVGILAGRVGRA